MMNSSAKLERIGTDSYHQAGIATFKLTFIHNYFVFNQYNTTTTNIKAY